MDHELPAQLQSLLAIGDKTAVEQLLQGYRGRLKRMVAIHLDQELRARLDASDVVQESLAEAVRQLPTYLAAPSVALYPWLRKLAWEKLLQLRQHHLQLQKRSRWRERSLDLNDESTMQLAERLVSKGANPSEGVIRGEIRQRVQQALAQLSAEDREILSMRHLEQLSVEEATAALGISRESFKKRHWRAMQRLRPLLEE